MASTKSTRSRKGIKAAASSPHVLRFPEVKGKIVERVQLFLTSEDYAVEIRFQDKTALNFDMEPRPGILVTPDLADWKTGNWKSIKRWPAVHIR